MDKERQIFVNLPVKNLKKSMEFFTALGFSFNPEFTDENAACMIISEDIYAMLLVKKFFKTFITKEIADSRKTTEVILALTAGSREEVDATVKKALESGGKKSKEPEDHGWMYAWGFQDPDGHLWEVVCMDKR